MSVIEIEQQIKPLSRAEKLRLIADLTKMLQEEESDLYQYFTLGEVIDYHGPVIEPKVAKQLDEYMGKKIKEGAVNVNVA